MDKNKEFILKGSEPTHIEVRRGDDTVEDAVYSTFMNHMKGTLSSMLVRETFSASAVPDSLAKEAVSFAPEVGGTILKREKMYEGAYGEVQPLHQSLAEVALQEREVKFVVDPHFIDFFTGEIKRIPDDYFAKLEEYHNALSQTAIIELLGQIERWIGESGSHKNWVEQTYRLVQLAVEHPQHYTPPVDHPESLMLLTFLNYKTRQLTRRAIVGNFLLAQTEANAGELRDDDERAALDTLRQFFKADALSGQHWNDNAYHHHISEAVVKDAAKQKAKKIHAVSELQRLFQTPGGERIHQEYVRAVESLRRVIEAEDKALPFKYWQQMDIGHTFEGFRSLEMLFALQRQFKTREALEKDKGRAAILEDDAEQMELWSNVLDRHSRYVVNESNLTSDPIGIVKMADDPEIRLFLLDIQNGEDRMAGIRAAKAIIERKLELYKSQASEESPQTTIIVWSTSIDSISEAHEAIDQLLGELPEEDAQLISANAELGSIQNSKGFGRTPININLQLKGLDSWDLS